MKYYKLNGNITVLPGRNMVNDVKLEPRLMKLLCLLLEKKGQTVTREEIIHDIWNGYGGGDDGLTQAVSFLRKVLNDTDKTLIETVPKLGYIFNGEVEMEETEAIDIKAPATHKMAATNTIKIIGVVSIIVLLLFVILFFSTRKNTRAPLAPPADSSINSTPAPKPS